MKNNFFAVIATIIMAISVLVPMTVSASTALNDNENINVVSNKTYKVTKSYKYDVNKYSGSKSHYRSYQYKNIPSWSKYKSYKTFSVGGGWNYTSKQHVNYFSEGY